MRIVLAWSSGPAVTRTAKRTQGRRGARLRTQAQYKSETPGQMLYLKFVLHRGFVQLWLSIVSETSARSNLPFDIGSPNPGVGRAGDGERTGHVRVYNTPTPSLNWLDR